LLVFKKHDAIKLAVHNRYAYTKKKYVVSL